MTRLARLIAAIAGIAFALHLVYGWRPAPRVDGLERLVGSLKTFQVDRDAWPEGVGW